MPLPNHSSQKHSSQEAQDIRENTSPYQISPKQIARFNWNSSYKLFSFFQMHCPGKKVHHKSLILDIGCFNSIHDLQLLKGNNLSSPKRPNCILNADKIIHPRDANRVKSSPLLTDNKLNKCN